MFFSWLKLRDIGRWLQEEYREYDVPKADIMERVIRVTMGLEHRATKLEIEVEHLRNKLARYENRPSYDGARDLRGPVKFPKPSDKPVVDDAKARDTRAGSDNDFEPTRPAWYPSVQRDDPPPVPPFKAGGAVHAFAGGGADASFSSSSDSSSSSSSSSDSGSSSSSDSGGSSSND